MKKVTSFLLLSNLVFFNDPPLEAKEGANMPTDKPKTTAVKTAQNTTSSQNSKKLLNAKVKTLSNGLRIVVVEEHIVPRVSFGVLYNVGVADDPENLVGLSHMTEHMFFHGSTKYPHIDETIGTLGGYINACTGADFTMYIIDTPASALPLLIDIEADRMANFNLTNEATFRNEQKAVFEERLRCIDNRPLGLALEYIDRVLCPQHPYGVEIIGMPHHIHAYTREAIMNHYHTWYKPNNATLIVIGDVEASKVFAEAQKAFGHIPAGEVPERKRVQNTIKEDLFQDITYYSDCVASEKVDISYTAPSHTTHSLKECMAFGLALNVLCNGAKAPLSFYFIDQKKMASDVSARYDYTYFDPISFTISASLLPKVSANDYIKCYKKKMAELLQKGISQKDFERAKNSAEISLYKKVDNHHEIRYHMALLSCGFTMDEIEDMGNVLSSLTLEDVNTAFLNTLSKDITAIVRICPKQKNKQ